MLGCCAAAWPGAADGPGSLMGVLGIPAALGELLTPLVWVAVIFVVAGVAVLFVRR